MPELPLGGTTVEVEIPSATFTATPPVDAVMVVAPGPPTIVTEAPSGETLVVPIAGPAGAARTVFSYSRVDLASTWTIVHNLGTYPVPVILLDDDPNRPVWTDVEYLSANALVLTFPTPVTGRVYL